jgi:hypothetical protein
MYVKEGYQWAGSILAFLAILLVPIPFILERYGRELRLRSPVSKSSASLLLNLAFVQVTGHATI